MTRSLRIVAPWLLGAVSLVAFVSPNVVLPGEALGFGLGLTSPGKDLRTLIRRLLTHEFSRPGSWELAPDPARKAVSVWIRAANDEPPFLFVMPGGGYCGAANCLILGFRKTTGGWIRVYSQFGGESIEVLDAITNGYHDLRQWEDTTEITSHWDGNAYATADRRQEH
jgi:hypothetical protein